MNLFYYSSILAKLLPECVGTHLYTQRVKKVLKVIF